MATSKENETSRIMIEPTLQEVDSCSSLSTSSRQQLFSTKRLKKKGKYTMLTKKTPAKSSRICPRFVAHETQWLTNCRTSSRGTIRSNRHSHNHENHTVSSSSQDQNSANSMTSKAQTANEPKDEVIIDRTADTISISSNKQCLIHEKSSRIAPHSFLKTKTRKIESKIPVRISETALSSKSARSITTNSLPSSISNRRVTLNKKASKIPRPINTNHSLWPKQNLTIKKTIQVINNQESSESFNTSFNHGNGQKLLMVSNQDDDIKNDITLDQTRMTSLINNISLLDITKGNEEEPKKVLISPESLQMNVEKTKTDINFTNISELNTTEKCNKRGRKNDVVCTENSWLDTIEAKTLFSINNYDYDLSLSNKEENDLNKIQLKFKQTDINKLQENDIDEIGFEILHRNEFNNNSLIAFMKEQSELKFYYDKFPNIDDITNETSLDMQKSQEFTKSVLYNLPSGDINDRETVCHILNKLFENEHQEYLFFDSENDTNLHNAFVNLVDINSQDRPFVLKLSSSEGLGNRNSKQTEEDDLKLAQILTNIIEQKQAHPVIDDIIERLSKVYDVSKEHIIINHIYVGTFNIVYTVLDLTKSTMESLTKIPKELKHQFKQYISAKIHPLLFRPSFDIAYFDHRGNKSFPSESETHEVGPPGHTQVYTTPSGWTRYGLKVLGIYSNDKWLHPFKHPGNWYRAFHGTGRAQSQDFGNDKQLLDTSYACVDALSSIYEIGFRPARVDAYGSGVYCSPNPKFPERGYVRSVSLNTQQGKKTFKSMLQVAVNPDSVKFTSNKDIWVVPDPKNIRPYGILIKEVFD